MSYYYTIPSTRSSGCSRRCSRNKAGSRRAAYPYGYGHGYIGDISNFASSVMSDNTCKVIEDDTKYEVLLDVPGVKAKDIKVQLEEKDTVLSIKAIRKPRDNDDSESVEQTIEKRLGMGTDVDVSSISASAEDGVLTVTVLKLKYDDSVRSIPVGSGHDEDKTVVAGNISMDKNDGKAVDVTKDAKE
mmetsp:Transcript_15265/g.22534  ORF Transcript_15265/g.22534 Transcript_15265/m.22534 type:complete len:187 (-) Transcript_15265:13-573(-)